MSNPDRCPNCQSPEDLKVECRGNLKRFECGSGLSSGKLVKSRICFILEVEQLRKANTAALARVKELEKQLADVTAHRDRLIDSSIEAWSRVDDKS